MKLAFCIFRYFPYGGVERDMMRIAKACVAHGHSVSVYTQAWGGDVPSYVSATIVSVHAHTNHGRALIFSRAAISMIQKYGPYDAIIGFNKMAGLDFCFVGDVCFKKQMADKKIFIHRFLPRYTTYLQMEKEVFSQRNRTKIFLLTLNQKKEYQDCYHTESDRMIILPPGLGRREEVFVEKKFKQNGRWTFLFIASNFYNKGLDRAIKAVNSLPNDELFQLLIIGGDDSNKYKRLIKENGKIKFLGARNDLQSYFEKADLLIHPARVEAAGMVLIEALVVGVPIITTAVCGYAFHIEAAKAGVVVDEPFKQEEFNLKLKSLLNLNRLNQYYLNALNYAKNTDFYSMGEKAAIAIESWVKKHAARS